ncbi:hypothetical protein TVAG_032740 [Trichomonas vaginalis G3]|uniref:BACK domain-containing protein n=1 Tax=Trichomonas vaginalis (strain ATCC PRA-98 / G3) TaxID=412133 RepID=A2FMI9_TRIV3|nr:spectrin binding [Trichomonas vaginalis G3]EAX93888.1 hypothetical protein TVAG_032740 [Trichomonas vaginalis G3]KAI5541534.1 spectrin binding [Trichomonas vaginalis G3]|eukprot:XP_001306818.1 hypothetical protein [Trichomonas vaginalis G3]
MKSSAVCFSDLIRDKCIKDKILTSYKTDLNIKCLDSIDILSKFLETGKLEFPEDEDHYHDIFEIGKHFGNQILIQIYIEYIKLDKYITKENVFQKYQISVLENDTSTEKECIEFISSHLYCFSDNDIIENFAKNGYEFCEKILSSKQLKIINEDKLALLLLEICKMNNALFDLFRYIKLSFCSSEILDQIYNFSIERSFESVLLTIYNETIKNYHSYLREKFEISNQSILSFEKPFTETKITISNNYMNFYDFVKASEVIKMELSASTIRDGSLSNINSYRNDVNFHTQSYTNSWIKADLKGYKLKPMFYILQSTVVENDSHFLRRWKLEGIKEDGTTIVLNSDKYYEFNRGEIKEFPLQTNEYFVSFKLTQTGENSSNTNYLQINIFDFIGDFVKI